MANKTLNRRTTLKGLSPGGVPFWLRQKSLVSLDKHTLRPGGYLLNQRAVEFCDFTKVDSILDAGCGYGMTLGYLYESWGIKGTGIDPDFNALEKKGQKTYHSKTLVQAALPALPFKPGRFNGIFCECVLSLANDPAAWLREMYRVLSTNGKLVLTDLYIRKYSALARDRSNQTRSSCISGAVTLVELLNNIENAGFQIDIIENHTRLLNQLGTPARTDKTGYCMIIAGKYR
ncbi:MAG: methyltransferase domain-containing protein [Desulfobacter sp.]|nr:MAG: methyltransferase domain-containing protein [Desulfobacter sp.]